MYRKYKGLLTIKCPVYYLKEYLSPDLKPEKRDQFIRDLTIRELKNLKNKKLGYFLSLKNYSNLSIKVSHYDNNLLEVVCTFEAYFCKIEQNEIVLARISEISPTGVKAYVHNKNLEIEVSATNLSNEPITYKESGLSPGFLLSKNIKLKENDLIKTKILNITASPSGSSNKMDYHIKGTCAVKGLGKI